MWGVWPYAEDSTWIGDAAPEASAQSPESADHSVNHHLVSVIVAARNYRMYLGECFQSILRQTAPPAEVIYVDDGSTDESIYVAQCYEDQGVRVVSQPWRGAVAARRVGAQHATGECLCFVDGDDVLSPTFLSDHCDALRQAPDAAFAYGPAQHFGLTRGYWRAPEWDRDRLWHRNYVNTSALYRRAAYDRAGGWRERETTMWDWDLALRASRHGPGVRSRATLLYRRHGAGNSMRFRGADRERKGCLRGAIRQAAARVAVLCPVSGRVPEIFPEWLGAITRSIHAAHRRPDSVELVLLLDGPPDERTCRAIGHFSESFARVTLLPETAAEGCSMSRDATAVRLAGHFTRLTEATDAEVVWMVEDDILVPDHAFARLYDALLDGLAPRGAVAGLYRNRHHPRAYVAHQFSRNGRLHVDTLTSAPAEPLEVDATGTGCLMVFRPMAPSPLRFDSHCEGVAAHDWAFAQSLARAGQPVLLHPGVRCQHAVDGLTRV